MKKVMRLSTDEKPGMGLLCFYTWVAKAQSLYRFLSNVHILHSCVWSQAFLSNPTSSKSEAKTAKLL